MLPNTGARLFAAKDQAVPDKPATPEGWQDGAVLRSFAFLQNPAEPWYDTMNAPRWREVEIASGSGHGNACGVARIYGATVGEVDGISLMSKDQLERMITEQHNQTELLQERPYHQALGVLLNTPEAVYMGPNMRSFGHHGLGGSIGNDSFVGTEGVSMVDTIYTGGGADLILLSADRTDFVSRLFSLKRPAGLTRTATVQEIFDAYADPKLRSQDFFKQNLAAVKRFYVRLIAGGLSPADAVWCAPCHPIS